MQKPICDYIEFIKNHVVVDNLSHLKRSDFAKIFLFDDEVNDFFNNKKILNIKWKTSNQFNTNELILEINDKSIVSFTYETDSNNDIGIYVPPYFIKTDFFNSYSTVYADETILTLIETVKSVLGEKMKNQFFYIDDCSFIQISKDNIVTYVSEYILYEANKNKNGKPFFSRLVGSKMSDMFAYLVNIHMSNYYSEPLLNKQFNDLTTEELLTLKMYLT